MTEKMRKVFNKNGCDKGDGMHGHGYWRVYGPKMEKDYDNEVNILEIGIWKGKSMKSFHEIFPNAQLYGIDVFTRIPSNEIAILKEERVHWSEGDSRNPESVARMFNDENWGSDIQFDYIIDDGEHTPIANLKTFKNFYPYLKPGGKYFIEDIWKIDDMTTAELSFNYLTKNNNRNRNKQNPILYNELVDYAETQGKVEHHDLRFRNAIINGNLIRKPDHKHGSIDSYIIEITKPL